MRSWMRIATSDQNPSSCPLLVKQFLRAAMAVLLNGFDFQNGKGTTGKGSGKGYFQRPSCNKGKGKGAEGKGTASKLKAKALAITAMDGDPVVRAKAKELKPRALPRATLHGRAIATRYVPQYLLPLFIWGSPYLKLHSRKRVPLL